jgi:hypothetical protein
MADSIVDRGPLFEVAGGVESISASLQRPEHRQAIDSGMAHFAGLPLIDLRGDFATVTSYLLIAHVDHQGRPRHLPNHGMSPGYRVHRIVVNRWDLVRCGGRWMIAKRTLLPIDGSRESLALLRRGLDDQVSTD